MNTKYQTKSCKVKNAKIWQTLILHNCLPLGEHARFTSKNVAQYLLGSRNDYNLFKFNEIKHLLLKFTPLIETLFRSKVVLGYKVGSAKKIRYCKPVPPKDPSRYQEWYAKMKNVKIAKHHNAYYYKTLEKKRPVKILFASTNPTYTDIIKTSAGICQMNASTNRWLCGSITANSQPLGKQLKLSKELNTFTSKSIIERQFEKTFSENKEAKEKRYNWHNLNMLTQRPALAIIPDIANNDMILRETVAKTIPVIGLVNSDESTKIAYPIFGNSDSVQIVHFFCNFLAVLIAKTFVQVEYKQSSHRIFNRTRAFVTNKSKKIKATSVDANSKSKILAQTKTFPWIKKRIRFKKRPKIQLKYSKNATRKATKKSLYNLAKYRVKKLRKLHILRKNTNLTQIKIQNYNKLKYVGQQPYWKNLKAMMYLLAKDKYPRKYSLRWYRLKRKTKREEQKRQKRLRKPNVESKTITSESVGEMIKAKQKKLSIHAVKRYKNFLMERFSVKLQKLLKDKKKSLLFKRAERRVVSKNIRNGSNKIAKLKKRVIVKSRPRRPKFYKKGYLWKLAKKNKRKALIKAYGHSHLIDRRKRNRVQGFSKFKTRKKRKFQLWKRKRIFAKEITRNPLEKREERITNILDAIVKLKITHTTAVQKNKAFQKLYMALKNKRIKAKNMKKIYKKRSEFAKTMWRSPKLFNALVKKYPYYTLLARNLFSERNPSLSKTAFKVLSYELTNKKSNPYAFSLKNLHRKHRISNSILWQKLYYKNWIMKWKKKRFVQIAKRHVFFVTAKIKKRGLIGPSRATNMYYFRKKLHLSNSRNFPTYVKRIRKSFNRHLLKSAQGRTKSVKFYRRRTRRFVYKFRRFHQILPSLAHRFKPYRKNYRRRYKRRNFKKKFIAKNKQKVNKKKVLKKRQPPFWKIKKANTAKRRFVFVPNHYKGKNILKQTKPISNFTSKETKNFEKNIKGKKNKVSNVINVSSNVNSKNSAFTQNTNIKDQLRKKEIFVVNKEAKFAQNFTNVQVKTETTKLNAQANNIKASSTKRDSSNDKKQKYINKKNNDKK